MSDSAGPGHAAPVVEWGVAGAALEGGESGDVHVVALLPRGAVIAVIDGLGHGPEAALAAHAAARVIDAHAIDPLPDLVLRCHEALRKTRGAVLSVASFDAETSSMAWLAVGNVEALLVRGPRSPERGRESITHRGGVVGYQLPPLRVSRVAVWEGDTLVLATDGIRSAFVSGLAPHGPPQDVAEAILAQFGRGNDDALVLVARYLGAAP